MKRVLFAIIFCLLILSTGCFKRVQPEPAPVTGGEPAEVTQIEEGLSETDTIEEEIGLGEDIDEDFLSNLDW